MTIPFQPGFSPGIIGDPPIHTWPTPFPITYPLPELITGIHVDVSGLELKTLLEGRLAHHRERLSFYDGQLKTMAGMDVDGAMGRQTSGSMSPIEAINQAMKKHSDQVGYFKFTAEHVKLSAVYRLSDSDLQRLGVMSERFY